MDTDVTVLPLMPVKSGNLEQAAVHMLFFFNRETFSQVVSLEKTHPAEAGRCRGIIVVFEGYNHAPLALTGDFLGD